MIIKSKHSGYTADGIRRVYVGGGGGGGSQTATSYTSNVPEYAEKPFMDMVGKGVALSNAPYQAYGGERTAQFTPLQQQAFQQAGGQQVAPQIGQASGLAGLASQQALQAGGYQPGTFTPMGVQAPQLSYFQMQNPQQVGSQSFTQDGAASQYMNPYMQNVVDIQQREAQRQADIAGTQRGAQAVRAGAFGGSRQAIMDAEAQRNLAQQKGDIQATGSQAAFQQAQQQFNAEQDARMRAAMANQQAGLTAGTQNLSAALGVQQLGANQSLDAQRANQQALMDAQKAFEQSRQFGADVGLRGGAQAIQGAQTLGQLGQQQFGQQMDITGLQNQMGTAQQQQIQNILNQQYADFQQQKDYPYQQLGFLSDLLRGTGSSTRTVYPAPSTTSQLAGLGTAAAGLYGMAKAAGGEVKSYAAGGIASLNQPEMASAASGMSDPQLQQTQGLPSITDLAKMTLAAEAQQRAQMRQAAAQQQAAMAQQPQSTIAEEQMAAIAGMDQGLGGLDVPDDMVSDEGMAGGGIVAFAGGNEVLMPEIARDPRLAALLAGRKDTEAEEEMRLLPAFYRALTQGKTVAQVRGDTNAGLPAVSPTAAPSVTSAGNFDSRFSRGPVAGGITDQPPARPTPAPRVAGPSAAPTGAVAGVPPAAAAGIAGLLPKPIQSVLDRARNEDAAANKIRETAAESELEATKRDQAERGEIGAERDKRQKAQEKSLEGADKKNLNMALIEAGLAIMAGNSANAFENIGKGALVGTKAYTTGMERIQSRREKLDEAIMELDELRYGEKKASKKEIREAEAKVNEAKRATAAAGAVFTGKEFEVAVDLYTKQKDREATMAAASIRAANSGAGEGSKAIKEAEAAYARDPEALAIKKRLEGIGSMSPAKRATDEAKLNAIRLDKYRQFGVTLEGAAGASPLSSQDQALINKYR
jgi:hypothetical protein